MFFKLFQLLTLGFCMPIFNNFDSFGFAVSQNISTLFCWAISSPMLFSGNRKVFLSDHYLCFVYNNEGCFAGSLSAPPSASGSASASASGNHLHHLFSLSIVSVCPLSILGSFFSLSYRLASFFLLSFPWRNDRNW